MEAILTDVYPDVLLAAGIHLNLARCLVEKIRFYARAALLIIDESV